MCKTKQHSTWLNLCNSLGITDWIRCKWSRACDLAERTDQTDPGSAREWEPFNILKSGLVIFICQPILQTDCHHSSTRVRPNNRFISADKLKPRGKSWRSSCVSFRFQVGGDLGPLNKTSFSLATDAVLLSSMINLNKIFLTIEDTVIHPWKKKNSNVWSPYFYL